VLVLRLIFSLTELSDRKIDDHAVNDLIAALVKGGPERPALPPELVAKILRFSELLEDPVSIHPIGHRDDGHEPPRSIVLGSFGAEEVRQLWFCTAPITAQLLRNVAQIQFNTFSNSQGWASDPSAGLWSWFDLVIYRARDPVEHAALQSTNMNVLFPLTKYSSLEVKIGTNAEPLRWTSHTNNITSREPSWHSGVILDPKHEIWENLEVGDVIGVEACARFPGWRCEGHRIEIVTWIFHDPTRTEPFKFTEQTDLAHRQEHHGYDGYAYGNNDVNQPIDEWLEGEEDPEDETEDSDAGEDLAEEPSGDETDSDAGSHNTHVDLDNRHSAH
jgi:hypothetical protein